MLQKTTLGFFLLFLVLFVSCIPAKTPSFPPQVSPENGQVPGEETAQYPSSGFSFKGIWLSQFDLSEVYLSGGKQREKADFEKKMEAILRQVSQMGFTAVIVQVHPYGDSFYPSSYFPTSRFISGSYGKEADYDPFAVTVALCRRLGLEVHAWINPLRLMKEEEFLLLEEDQILRRWLEEGEGQVTLFQGRGYLDPAFGEVRELIACAARELCENYGVDGVHIDDYFYPTTSQSFDRLSYERYCKEGGSLSLSDYRKENLSSLVALLYRTVKETGTERLFGISPAGNIDNVVKTMYADVVRWCSEEGFADYICPQLYYGFEHEKCPFEQTLRQWKELCQGGKVELVIGLTFTKVGLQEDPYAGSGKGEWAQHDDILRRSALAVYNAGDCAGICVFSYSYLRHPLKGTVPPGYEAEVENFLSVFPKLTFESSS